MSRNLAKLIPADFPALPGLTSLEATRVECRAPREAQVVGYAVFAEDEDVPAELGFTRTQLTELGFDAKVGSSQLLPRSQGSNVLAVGAGKRSELDGAALRDLAAAAVSAAAKFSRIALVVPVEVAAAAQFLTEGAVLARYRYSALKSHPDHTPLELLELEMPGAPETAEAQLADVKRGLTCARATVIARDLTNTPPGYLTATDLAETAVELGAKFGFDAEVFGKEELIELGCGGLLGVNRGSSEPPQMIKLHYRPGSSAANGVSPEANSGSPKAHIGLVGKGITYDSGGISLKPSDGMHLLMKMDMGGAGAVVGTMSSLADLQVPVEVTAWLMCTDNMISGDAYRLGDVLTAADGTTVEVKNTDAEGRLVLMDGISLAVREGVDAIVDIATLTGAAVVALGESLAATFTGDDHLAELLAQASRDTGEDTWQLPLVESYKEQLDSKVADIANVGSTRFGGAIAAALFLQHFAAQTPWAHVDIAGPMNADSAQSWRPAGATGFGARLLLDVLRNY